MGKPGPGFASSARPCRNCNAPGIGLWRLIEAATAEKNRIGKVMEDANVKLGNVLTDVFGASGQLMLEALLKGIADPAEIAAFAKSRAKQKIPEITEALEPKIGKIPIKISLNSPAKNHFRSNEPSK